MIWLLGSIVYLLFLIPFHILPRVVRLDPWHLSKDFLGMGAHSPIHSIRRAITFLCRSAVWEQYLLWAKFPNSDFGFIYELSLFIVQQRDVSSCLSDPYFYWDGPNFLYCTSHTQSCGLWMESVLEKPSHFTTGVRGKPHFYPWAFGGRSL